MSAIANILSEIQDRTYALKQQYVAAKDDVLQEDYLGSPEQAAVKRLMSKRYYSCLDMMEKLIESELLEIDSESFLALYRICTELDMLESMHILAEKHLED